MPIEYIFCFICSEQCIKIISSRKNCGLFNSVFKKNIPNKTNSTNLYPPTKCYLREICKSKNINPIYLTLSSLFV